MALPKKIAVVGLGKTGVASIEYFLSHGCEVLAFDTRSHLDIGPLQARWPTVAFYIGEVDPVQLSMADQVLMSPGLDPSESPFSDLSANGLALHSELAFFRPVADAPLIAITGSNAKSTVTSLVGTLLQASGSNAAVGGNLGTPCLQLIDADVHHYVLELSSFQLELTYHLNARVATVLNVSEDHLDRHGTLENYAQIKRRIYEGCEVAVFNRDDALTVPDPHYAPQILVSFGMNAPCSENEWGLRVENGRTWLCKGSQFVLAADQLQIKGRHNAINALAALAVVEAAGVTVVGNQEILRAACEFQALEHRCEWVATIDGVDFINDSKGTNVGAAVAAIEGFSEPNQKTVILIAGGQGKGADFSPLIEAMPHRVKHVMLIGEAANQLRSMIGDAVPCSRVSTMDAAVSECEKIAGSGDTVLLSPACASFDMFDNFEHRGNVFKQSVRALQGASNAADGG